MTKTADNRQILTQVISLPLLLGTLLLVTGLGGIYISKESAAELQRLNDKALGPTLTFGEIVAQLNETSQIILRASSEGTSNDERESLLKKTRSKLKKIGKMTKEALQASQGYAYSEYFSKWAADWDGFQTKVTAEAASYKEFAPHISETDKELGELVERIGNVSTFIQADVKDIVDQSAAFSKKATYGLISLLAIGLVIGLLFSTLIVRGIRRLLVIIDNSKKNMKTLLDNLDQGFLVFDKSGTIQPEVSKAANQFFGTQLANANFVQVLPMDDDEKRNATSWLELVYGGALTFKSLADLAPESFEREGRYIELQYRPIYFDGSNDKLDKVICVASDKTEERNLRRRAEAESTLVRVVMKVLSDRPAFVDFVLETRALFKELFNELVQPQPRIDNLFRSTHSIKGSLGAYSFDELARSAHHFENQLADLRGQPNEKVIALAAELNEGLLKLQQDFEAFLVKHENVLGPTKESTDRTKSLSVATIHKICQLLESEIGKESQLFQTYVKNFVQDDASLLFQRYESVVTGVAERQMKFVEFKMSTGGIKVFSDPYMPLANAYVHVFRNAVDHGIEDPEARIEAGKPETAHVEVRMSELPNTNGQNILRIEVVDDGRGVNPSIIRQKAVEKGIISEPEAEKMTDHEVVQLLFRAGFSTNTEVTDLSGRGVGLDAVKYEVEKLGGTIRIESEAGRGTRVIADVPHFKSVISAQTPGKPGEMRMAS